MTLSGGTQSQLRHQGKTNREVYNFLMALKESSRFYDGISARPDEVASSSLSVNAINRNCGDSVDLHAHYGDRLKLTFSGYFCAVCHASSEILCSHINEAVEHNLVSWNARSKNHELLQFMTQIESPEQRRNLESHESLSSGAMATLRLLVESLEAFAVRFQCASLPWKALKNMIEIETKQGVKKS